MKVKSYKLFGSMGQALWAFAVIAASVLYACTKEEEKLITAPGNIKGIVTDFKTGQPLTGVNVMLQEYTTTVIADSEGKFLLADIDVYAQHGEVSGSYTLLFAKSGYQDNTQKVTVYTGKTAYCSVALTGDPDFEIENGVLTAYHGKSAQVIIPEGVTSIGSYAFLENRTITSVVIPEGVTSIGVQAFDKCSKLNSITIPNSVIAIGNWAFRVCGLTSVKIGSGLTNVGIQAFLGCALLLSFTVDAGNNAFLAEDGVLFDKAKSTLIQFPGGKSGSYTIPSSVVAIEEYAFTGSTKLTSIVIPESVTSIGEGAFLICEKLTSVTARWTNPIAVSSGVFDNTLAGKALYVPTGTKAAYQKADVWKNFGTIVIPSVASGATGDCTWTLTGTDQDYTLTISGSGAMADYMQLVELATNITFITVPWSKYLNSIKTVVIREGVTTIGDYAFASCSGLTGLTIPNSVTTIGDYAFASCSGLTGINVNAGNSNYSSADGVLFNKNKTELIAYPAGKTGNYAIPNSVTTIGVGAFVGSSGLTGVTIPNSVTTIGGFAFRDCSGLASVTIGNSVTTIGNYAFQDCSGLASVTIGNSVTTIGNYAFYFCTKLNTITNLCSTPQNISGGVFTGTSISSGTLRVPVGSVNAYKAADGWKNFKNIVAME
ncbi:MAG: leucine-rich repeat protein [Prevotellaceae bacterium]|jgi:hypothetical protein|nr:leucine-rich repeat protein [Prevotellaceae bacterium]